MASNASASPVMVAAEQGGPATVARTSAARLMSATDVAREITVMAGCWCGHSAVTVYGYVMGKKLAVRFRTASPKRIFIFRS